ncbi:hypothetical protein [Actinomadura sp. K4S16]|uniref:hypothetical protein n=1 Tax=Actinomadura sp. K4S16 TaxID=1316147 RepID=UPI0011EE4A89|nr:hypothetical protein [Actinomadura sp. K4S16]
MSGNAEGSRRYERWFQGLRDRSALLLIGVTILGTLLVAVGWVVEGADYVPELLLQAGSALMMLVPLAFLGLVLEGRMRHTERRVEETVAQINALSVATREQLADHHRLRSDLFAGAEANPTQQVIRVLLEDAAAINAIAQEGVRVRVQGTSLRARFRNAPDRSVQIRLERGDGSVLDTVSWPAQQPAEAFAAELRTALHTVQPSFPAQGFDPSELLTRLIRVIHLAVDARTGDSVSISAR